MHVRVPFERKCFACQAAQQLFAVCEVQKIYSAVLKSEIENGVCATMQGRDANRLLQRVIKAEEKKKKLPKMIARLRQQLAEWQAPPQSNKPFVLGHVAYGPEVLDLIEEELKVMADVKPRKVRSLQALLVARVRVAAMSLTLVPCRADLLNIDI